MVTYLVIAEEKLSLISNQPIIVHEVTISSLLLLCEIKLRNFQLNPSNLLIREIQDYVDLLYDIAQENHMYVLLIEILIIRAKINLYNQNDAALVEKLLAQAEIMAIEIESTQLIEYISEFWNHIGVENQSNMETSHLQPILTVLTQDFQKLVANYT